MSLVEHFRLFPTVPNPALAIKRVPFFHIILFPFDALNCEKKENKKTLCCFWV